MIFVILNLYTDVKKKKKNSETATGHYWQEGNRLKYNLVK